MSSDGSLLLQLILLFVLIFINAFFAASEIAVITVNDNKLRHMAEEGNEKASLLARLLSQPSSFLAAIQVGVTLAGLLSSAIASESFADRITMLFAGTTVSPSLVKALSIIVITILLSYFTLVFGELVPKRIAMQNPEKIAFGVVGTLNFVSKVFRPFVAFLAFSTNSIVRLFGISGEAESNNVTEEEIRMMVDVGEETGVIEESEKEMINNVFEFNDRFAYEIMTHRTDISAVELTATLQEIIEIGLNEGYSRIPVYEDDLDDIVGVLYVKDLLRFVGRELDKEFDIRDFMHPPLFVPESKRCRELFKVLKLQKMHMAIVIDEYGGTAGIVTMEDLLESIVGNIQDEYDHEEEEFSVIDESTFDIDGTTDIEEVCRLLDTELPEGEYDTLGGLIIEKLGRIPRENEHPSIDMGGFTFTVESVDERRIDRVKAVRKQPTPTETET